MKPNVNQDDINGKADRREGAFNSNIVVVEKYLCHTQIVGLLQKCNLFFNNMLHEHSVARGLVVYDNSEEKRKKGGKKSTLWCVKNISYRHKGFSLLFIRDKNEASRIDLKDTIHDLLQKRVISKLVYVTLFLYISLCFF